LQKENYMINITDITNKLQIDEKKVSNIYLYGSVVYQTNTEFSDTDYIIIYRQIDYKMEYHDRHPDIQATLYNISGFQLALDNQELSAIECYFLDSLLKIEKVKFNYIVDLQKLRESISKNVSNSWIKAKKKIYDGDIYIGQKSLFHCFRMIYFGKQLAQYNKILDYTGINYDENYKSLKELWTEISEIEDWKTLKDKYQSILNNKLSEFRLFAPKI
jgi:hypothetical protein